MTSRRDFIKKSMQATSFIGISGISPFLEKPIKQLTILHTNDVHGHLDAFASSHPNFANRGGLSKRMDYITNARKKNANLLLLDAGGFFQAKPFYQKANETIISTMNSLAYDVVNLGNQDFGIGTAALNNALEQAKFDIVQSNYIIKNNALQEKIKPYTIYNKSGLRIGIFGIGNTTLETAEISCKNPLETAKHISTILKKEEKCDIVICLSHLGHQYRDKRISDIILARETAYIDLIIGAYTHTLLEKPVVIKNKLGKSTLINQVAWGGLYLGEIHFYFDATNNWQATGKAIAF